MYHWRGLIGLATQLVEFRQIHLVNGLIILLTCLKMSAQDAVLLTAAGHIHTPKNKDVTDIATEHGVAIIHLSTNSTQKNSATRCWFHGVLPNISSTRD
jgi:hypothetical protein